MIHALSNHSDNNNGDSPLIYDPETEIQIQQDLLKQAESENVSDFSEGLYTMLSAPTAEDGATDLVEVQYMGKIAYVDISFENLSTELTEQEFASLIEDIETMAYETDLDKVREASRSIEAIGENAIDIIFRECRKFDLADDKKKNEIVHLLSRLTMRSLKGRRIVKAILENASSQHHIRLAIMVAGVLHDRELENNILNHARNSDYFLTACESLFMIRSNSSIKPLISLFNNFEISRKDIMEMALHLAPRFSEFGLEAIEDVFQAYLTCRPQLRPVFLSALRSFKAEAIPKMEKILIEETNGEKLVRICKILGELKHPYATKILLDQFGKSESKKMFIIEGFSHTKDPSLIPVLKNELVTTSDIVLKKKCLNSLAFMGDKKIIPFIKGFLQDPDTQVEAACALMRLGDDGSFDLIYNRLVNGSKEDQMSVIRYISIMPFNVLTRLASSITSLSDDKALIVVNALRRPNILPREAGPYLQNKLSQDIGTDLKIEIYRLIGRHVNSKHEVLPQSVLYAGRREESNTTVIHEIDQLIASMKKEKGLVSTIRN